ncbi:MAG: TolC family protein [Flavobacteriales bacterium]|nr:TolC family protein [Flavobacteriales bacterium]NCQ11602.1 TolC family protein [Bacteroidota bacterium]
MKSLINHSLYKFESPQDSNFSLLKNKTENGCKKKWLYKLVNIHLFLFLTSASVNVLQAQTLTYEQAIDSALYHNKRIQAASLGVQMQQEKHKEAVGMLLPQLSASAEYKYFTELPFNLMPQSAFGGPAGVFKEVQFGVPHNIQASVQLQLPLYQPQIWGAIRATSLAEDLSHLQLKKTKEQVYLETANLYRQAQLIAYQKEITKKNLGNAITLEQLTQSVFDQGLAKETDLGQIQLQTAQLRDALLQLEQAEKQVLSLLKLQFGWTENRIIELDAEIISPSHESETTLPPVDFQITEIQQSLIRSELNTIKWSRLPSLSLFGSYGTTGFGYNESPNEFLNFYPLSFVGVKTQVNMFTGLSSVRKSTQKKIELKQTQLQQELLVDAQSAQLQQARFAFALAQSQVKTALQHIELAESVYTQTQLEFEQGVSALRDVLLANSALQKAQQTHIQQLVALVKAELEIKHISGNLLGDPQ